MPTKANNKLYVAAQELIRAANEIMYAFADDESRQETHGEDFDRLETAINAMRDALGEQKGILTGTLQDAVIPGTEYPVEIKLGYAEINLKIGSRLVSLSTIGDQVDALVFSDHTTQTLLGRIRYEYAPPPSSDPRNDPNSEEFWLLNP